MTGIPMYDRWERTFNGDGGDYMFTMSHVSLSGTDVELTYEPAPGGGWWTATQRSSDGDRTQTGRSRNHDGAVLALIAARLGLAIGDGDFIDAPDEDGS